LIATAKEGIYASLSFAGRILAISGQNPLFGIKVLSEDDVRSKVRPKTRLERSIESGTLLKYHSNSGNLVIFRDGMALAVGRGDEPFTFVYAKPDAVAISDLFRELGKNNVNALPSEDTTLAYEFGNMTLICERAQFISVKADPDIPKYWLAEREDLIRLQEAAKSLIRNKLERVYNSLVEGVPTTIHYERAIPIKVEKWPSDLPDPVEISLGAIVDFIGIKLPLPLWELISPDHEHGELRVQRLFEHDNLLFFLQRRPECQKENNNADGDLTAAKTQEGHEDSWCAPQALSVVKVVSEVDLWPLDAEVPLTKAKNRSIEIPEAMQRPTQSSSYWRLLRFGSRDWVSGSTLFRGVKFWRVRIAG